MTDEGIGRTIISCHAPKSYPKIKQHCRRFEAYFGDFLAKDIKPSMVEEY